MYLGWLLRGVAAEASWLLLEHSDDIVRDQAVATP
jgi:hypothetical protein